MSRASEHCTRRNRADTPLTESKNRRLITTFGFSSAVASASIGTSSPSHEFIRIGIESATFLIRAWYLSAFAGLRIVHASAAIPPISRAAKTGIIKLRDILTDHAVASV